MLTICCNKMLNNVKLPKSTNVDNKVGNEGNTEIRTEF